MPTVETTCQNCGARFLSPAGRIRVTCSRKCFVQHMENLQASRAELDKSHQCENEQDPAEHQRRIFIIKHNSMVNSGTLSAPLIPMDWLSEQETRLARRHRNRKDKRFN